MANNPFDLTNTGSSQQNNTAGTFNLQANNTPAGQPQANFSAITPAQGSTVSGQLNTLLSQDSPYLKEARARAQRQANGRGLINSSIAAGMGETAAIQSALPIAQQDAQTFFSAQQRNQDAANQFGLTNLNFSNQRTLNQDQYEFQGEQAGLDREQARTLQGNQFAFQGSQAALDRTQQKEILGQQQTFQGQQAGLDRAQQLTMQGNQYAFQGDQARLDREQQAGLVAKELQATADRQTQQLASTEKLATADNELRLALADKALSAEQTMATMNAALQRETASFLAKLNDESNLLAVTRGRNATMQQYQLQLGNSFLAATSQVLASTEPGFTAEMKEQTVARMKAEYQSLLDLAESLQSDTVLAEGQGGL